MPNGRYSPRPNGRGWHPVSVRLGRQRGDVEAGFTGCPAGFLVGACADDGGDGTQPVPVRVPLPQPSDVIGGPTGPFLDAAMPGIQGTGYDTVIRDFRIVEEQFHILVQRALIAFQGEALQKRRDLVALSVNRFLAQNQAALMGKGIENMPRRARLAVLGAAQGLRWR